jgi:hypothetical protein
MREFQAAGRITTLPDTVRMQTVTSVQQPCSNPSKTPERLGKASKTKNLYLQVFCRLQKPPAPYRAAFTRQRSLVRSQHRPLQESSTFQIERQDRTPRQASSVSSLQIRVNLSRAGFALEKEHLSIYPAAPRSPVPSCWSESSLVAEMSSKFRSRTLASTLC